MGSPSGSTFQGQNIAHQPQTLPLQQRMSTLAYHWAPRGYTSPANFLPLPLLHKFLVLIWLSIWFPLAAPISSSYDPCMCIAWAGSIVTKTLLFHTYYSCAGSVMGSCIHNHTTYQVCSPDNQYTCFNPTYHPVEQWLELRSGHLTGNIVTRTQVFDPDKPVSLLFDACAAIDQGYKLCGVTACGCRGLGWERTYTSNEKYMAM
jgi:hypothetical protein